MSNEINVGAISEALNNKVDLDQLNTNTQGLEYVSGLSMPSDKYIDLTLGASGSTYTAPANGWFSISKVSGIANGTITLVNTLITDGNNQDQNFTHRMVSPTTGMTLYGYIPAKKGDKVIVNYTATGTTTSFRFIYAEGAE